MHLEHSTLHHLGKRRQSADLDEGTTKGSIYVNGIVKRNAEQRYE
jgi:hypothetical protein